MSLIAWYELKENLLNKSTYNITATEHNIEWKRHGPLRFAYLNGLNSYIRINDHLLLNSGPIYENKTISIIIYPLETQSLQILYKQGTPNCGLIMYIYNNHIYMGGFNVTPGYNWTGSYIKAHISPNEWYNPVLQLKNGSNILGFLNGTNFNITSADTIVGSSSSILIGNNDGTRFEHSASVDNNSYFYNGYIQQFKHYNSCIDEKFISRYSENFLPNTKIVVPDQIRSIEAHKQSIYYFKDKNVYLSREINQFNNLIGNDLVLKGLYIQSVKINNNKLEVTLCSGILIQDLTLIEINEPSYLEIELNESGLYIIHTEFSFSDSYADNPFKLWLQYLNQDIYWDLEKTRVVLGVIEYDGADQINIIEKSISIHDRVYYIRGLNKFNMIDNLFEMNRHFDVFPVSEAELINTESQNYGEITNISSNVLFSENGNIILMQTNPYYDSRYLLHNTLLNNKSTNQNYDIFTDNGNLFFLESDNTDATFNPNIKDLGETYNFIQSEYELLIKNKNIELSNPNNIHSLCKKDIYEHDINLFTESQKSGLGSDFGYICGGYNNIHMSYISRFQFSIQGGNLQYKSNLNASKYAICGNNSTLHGYVCGGQITFQSEKQNIKNIERFSFPFDFGDVRLYENILHNNRIYSSSNNSSMYGYICGGENDATSERFLFPLETNTTYSIEFSNIRKSNVSHNCTYYGYVVGSDTTNNCKYDRYLFSLESNPVSDTYSIIENIQKYEMSSNNSSQYGYIYGNYVEDNNEISKYLFTTGGNTIINNYLGLKQSAGNNSTLYGYISCGYSLIYNQAINSIFNLNFSNDGITNDYIFLNEARTKCCAIDGVDFSSMFV